MEPPTVAPGTWPIATEKPQPLTPESETVAKWSALPKMPPSFDNSKPYRTMGPRDEPLSDDEQDNASVNVSGMPRRRFNNSFGGYHDEGHGRGFTETGPGYMPGLPKGAAAGVYPGAHRPLSDAGSVISSMHLGYYRLFRRPAAAIESLNPCDQGDNSISQFYIEHVPPPRKAKNYIAYICDKERIHPSRVKLYLSMMSEETGLEEMKRVHREDTLRRGPRECGASPDNPLLITVEISADKMAGSIDRTEAQTRLPVWIDGSRMAGRGVLHFGKWVGNTAKRMTHKEDNEHDL